MVSDVLNVRSFFHLKCSIKLVQKHLLRVDARIVLRKDAQIEIWRYIELKQHQSVQEKDRTYARQQKPSYHKEKRVFIEMTKTMRKMMIKVIKNRIIIVQEYTNLYNDGMFRILQLQDLLDLYHFHPHIEEAQDQKVYLAKIR